LGIMAPAATEPEKNAGGDGDAPVTAPRLESCYFGGLEWDRLARVLRHTARQHLQGWDVNVERIAPERKVANQYGDPGYTANALKLDRWVQLVNEARDGDRLLLIDTDTVVLAPLDPVWDMAFDVALTTKVSGSRPPFNAGVVFCRVNERTRSFFRYWRFCDEEMLRNGGLFQDVRKRYVGLNQSALGWMLELRGQPGRLPDIEDLFLRWIPCSEWNAEESCWLTEPLERARVLHVKGALAATVFKRRAAEVGLIPLADMWRQLELEARNAEDVCASA